MAEPAEEVEKALLIWSLDAERDKNESRAAQRNAQGPQGRPEQD